MSVLVTGGAGFIGSHLVDELIRRNYQVVIVDDLSTGKERNINRKAVFYQLKVENPDMEEVFKKEKPEILFHLAAQIDVRKSVENPFLDASINILGTINLLRLSIKYGVKKFIFSSSGGVIYGNTKLAATEKDPPAPMSPYGIAKLAGELYTRFYRREYGLRYTILRYANVYGERQDPFGEAGVVAIFSNQMLGVKPCTLYGYGKMARDYVYVGDVVSANILSIDKGEEEVFNIGTGIPTTVNSLFDYMKEITSYSLEPVYKPKRKGELDINFLNSEKAKKILGWKPEVDLKNGLRRTIDWLRRDGDKETGRRETKEENENFIIHLS